MWYVPVTFMLACVVGTVVLLRLNRDEVGDEPTPSGRRRHRRRTKKRDDT